MLRLRVLGALELEVDGAVVEPPESRRARSVLAWLALNRGPHPRVEVAGRFWPDLPEPSARGNLRLAIWGIRRALGPNAGAYLFATRDDIGLAANGAIWVDLIEFRRLIESGRIKEALALCRGEPLAELEDEWVYEPREEHREQVVEALGRLAAEAEARDEVRQAIALTRRQVALDPLGEEVARELMRRLAAAGDRGAALAAFERLTERLERELGIAPSRSTRELAYRLGSGSEEPSANVVTPRVLTPAEPRLAEAVAPLPPALARRERTPFVGREDELDQLRAELARAAAGEPRVVLLGGEAGVGKTRLAAELAREAASGGASVLFGHNDEDAVVAFQPFVEALRSYARTAPLDELGALLGDDAPEVARIVPELARRLPSPPPAEDRPETERYRMFEAVSALLRGLSATAPLLLVLDDLHWADRPTLRLLKHLARSPEEAALLVVATFRDPDPATAPHLTDLLADLRRDASVTRLALEGLAEPEVGELLVSLTEAESPPPALVRVLRRDTAGNPFFLQETLRHLSDAGILRAPDGHWMSPMEIERTGVAEGVKEVVLRRLATLQDPCRVLLALGAVAGRSFELDLLARMSGTAPEAVAETLEEAVRARIVLEEDDAGLRYSFSHALIRQTLYEDLPRSRRVRLHRAIADTLEDLHADALDSHLGDLAYHILRSARPRDAKRAVAYARRAGAQALGQLAYEEASAHFRRALEALELDPEPSAAARCQILLDLGSAEAKSGDQEEAAATFEAAAATARALARPDLLARAALGFAGTWALMRVGLEPRSVALLEEALAAIGESEPVLRARVLTRLSEELYYSPERERRAQLSAEALQLVRASGDGAALAMALGARHTALWSQQRVEERLELATEMSLLGRDGDDPEIAFQGAAWSFADRLELGHGEAAAAELAGLVALANELRQPGYRWWAHMLRATHAGMAGEFESAEEHIEAASFWGGRAEIRTVAMYAMGQRLYLRLDQGRAHEVVDEFRPMVWNYPAVPSGRCMLAHACAESGLEDEARREMQAMVQDEEAMQMMNASWSIGMYSLAMTCARIGDAHLAARLYDRLLGREPYCHVAFRAAAFAGSVARSLGVLAATAGRAEHAELHLVRAIEVNECIGALPQLVRSRADYGRLLHVSGKAYEAAEQFSSACLLADRLGMRGVGESLPR